MISLAVAVVAMTLGSLYNFAWAAEKELPKTDIPVVVPFRSKFRSVPMRVDKADRLLTNRRLRADAGSLSVWSISSAFNYQGGSLAYPLDPKRPNIVKGADALTLQNLTGDIGVRYRVTKLFSLTASTGLFWTTPFHGTINTDNEKLKKNFEENHQQISVNDPMLKASYISQLLNFQSLTQFRLTLITNNQQSLAGYQGSFYFSENLMRQVGNTKFSYGANIALLFYTFDKRNDELTDRVVGIYPAFEYDINDMLNFRTAFGTFVYQHLRGEPEHTYEKRKVYQSLGLGILLSRDVYLYPNLQYIVSDIRLDRSNIALSAFINIF